MKPAAEPNEKKAAPHGGTNACSTGATITDIDDLRKLVFALKAEGKTRLQVEARAEERACADGWKVPRDGVRAIVTEAFTEPPPETPEEFKAEDPPVDAERQVLAYWAVALLTRGRDDGEDPAQAIEYMRVFRPPFMPEREAEAVVRYVWERYSPLDAEEEAERIDAGGWTPPTFPRPRFQLFGFKDIIDRPSTRWLVQGLLPEDALCVLYGAPGAFKSFIGLDLALSIAVGEAWHGLAVGPPRPAIYIAGEGAGGLSRRLRAWAWDRRIEDVPLLRIVDAPVPVADPGDLAEFMATIAEEQEALGQPPAFFVVDTMARCMPGMDENSAADVGAFIDGVDKLRREYHATALVMHHADKQGRYERGSSALRGAVDVLLRVTREGKKPPVAILTAEKCKDTEDAADRRITLRTCSYAEGPDDNSLVINAAEITSEGSDVTPPTDVVKILALLRYNIAEGKGSYTRWQKVAKETLGVTEGTFSRHVKTLLDKKYVAKGRKRTDPYMLTAAGEEILGFE